MESPSRPLVRYHGGKWMLAPWIISQLPGHRVYVEPYGGGGSVLLRKPRSYAEVYNDLDGEIVGLWRVARDRGAELQEALRLTPFARAEFLAAWDPSPCELEQARRTVIRSFMGFGSAAVTLQRAPVRGSRGGLAPTGFRSNSNRSGTTPAHDWVNYARCFDALVGRLAGVVIENRDACRLIADHDGLETLYYVDPPYVLSSRDAGADYRYEMTDEDHCALAATLMSVKGMVVLSGYPTPLYEQLYGAWHRVERRAMADGARERTECLWFNSAALARRPQPSLMEAMA